MQSAIFFLQIILGVLVVLVIIIQQKGTGLGSTFGGSIGFYSTRRGAEKLLFNLTIILAVLFILASLISLII